MVKNISLLLSMMFCVALDGHAEESGIRASPLQGGLAQPLLLKKHSFSAVIEKMAGAKSDEHKMFFLDDALKKLPEGRVFYMEQVRLLLSKMYLEGKVNYGVFDDARSDLENKKVPLTKEELQGLLKKVIFSNMDRMTCAHYCWERDLKEFSFGIAFNREDRKRFRNHTAELKEVVVKAKSNPFRAGEKPIWYALSERELWSALVNYMMCFENNLNTTFSGIRPAIVSMMTLFGEEKVRSWVTDLDRRQRWLENPAIVAGYFYQQGKVDEAFKYLEDAEMRKDPAYYELCYNSGRFDKVIEFYQSKLDEKGKLNSLDHYKMAFAAQQIGNKELYELHLKPAFESVETEERAMEQQVKMFLILGEMEKALQIADRYDFVEDVFKLLCLSYNNEIAHQFVQVGKVIDSERIMPVEKVAKQYFTRLNHRFAKSYDPEWKRKNTAVKYSKPSDGIERAMKEKKNLSAGLLSELELSAENRELELKIVDYLMADHFSASYAERRLLERHKKWGFLSEHFYAKYQKHKYNTKSLFLAGHYAKASGKKKQGDRWMRVSYVLCYGDDYRAQGLIDTIKSVNSNNKKLDVLRKISRRCILCYPSGRQCYNDAYAQKDYKEAARTWVADDYITLRYRGSNYGNNWWAWHNSAHDDEALGQWEIDRGNLEKAYQHLLKVWKVSENRYQLGKNLYFAYLRRGENKKANEIYQMHWQRMKKMHLENPLFHWALSHLVRWSLACRKSMNGKALAYAKKLREMRGDRYFETRLLAEHYVLNKQPQKAREILKIWVERRPRDTELTGFLKTLKLPKRTLLEDGSYFGHQGWF